ncbi:MAG: zinc ABC transporter substrate-binding protein [Clostridia bacterium]|nr:zinc ABC transporter substrate-binding protein [Clostridia bacterium]
MTKRTAVILSFLLILGGVFTGCAATEADDGGISVVTTNFALYDFARAVCGDLADVTMLISPGSESHDFEATLADVAKIASSDLFVSVGSEDWADDIFTAIGEEGEGVHRITAMEICEVYGSECELPGHDHEHEHDGHDHEGEEVDEHVWTSIANALILLEEIGEKMAQIDPENGDAYLARMQAYADELKELDLQYREMISQAERKTIVVADRFPFLYLADEYGLEWHAAFSGCSSDTEPALSVINELIEEVQAEEIPAVFIIELSDGRTAGAVAYETGCEILTLQSAQNVSREEFKSGVTWLDLMRDNLEALRIALN